MDVGSREVALAALPTKETEGVAKAIMERVYLRGKAPRVWQSDNAKEFTSAVMKDLAKLLGAKFKHSSPYHPQTNTHVERYNKTIATQLSLMVERVDQRDWDEHLKFVEYANLVGAQASPETGELVKRRASLARPAGQVAGIEGSCGRADQYLKRKWQLARPLWRGQHACQRLQDTSLVRRARAAAHQHQSMAIFVRAGQTVGNNRFK